MIFLFYERHEIRRFGFKHILISNGLLASALTAACALFTPSTPFFVMIVVLLVGGFFRSLQFTALNAISYSDIGQREMGRATSLYSVAQQLSLAMGVACAAFVLEVAQYLRGDTSLSVPDFAVAFFVVALVSGLSIFSYVRLPADAGAEVSGKPAAAVER